MLECFAHLNDIFCERHLKISPQLHFIVEKNVLQIFAKKFLNAWTNYFETSSRAIKPHDDHFRLLIEGNSIKLVKIVVFDQTQLEANRGYNLDYFPQ